MSNSKAKKDTGTKKTVEKEKKNAIKWGPDNIETFLETFQNYGLLWNVRHDDYFNKAKRESSILKLKEDLISQGLVVPDLAFLRARIKAIKTTYRSELIKVLSSKTSGSGADDVYTPKLPWFETADTFLNSVVVTRESESNLKCKLGQENNEQPELSGILENDSEIPEQQDIDELDDNNTSVGSVTTTGSVKQDAPFVTPVFKRRRISKLSKVETAIDKLQTMYKEKQGSSKKVMDEFDVFGQHIANQLRTLPARSSIMLQGKFQSLITEEKLKHLPPDSSSYTSTSSHQTDQDDDLTEMDSDLFKVDDLIYRQLHLNVF